MKILIDLKYNSYLEKKIRAIRRNHPKVEIYTDVERAPIEEIEVFMGGTLPTAALKAASALKLIQVHYTGVNHLPLGLLKKRGVRVMNTHGGSDWVAEKAVGLLLAFLGRVAEFHHDLKQERWHGFVIGAGLEDSWTSVRGKTVGILGTGSVGLGCANLLKPFGCKLMGFRKSAIPLDPFEEISTDIDLVLTNSDIVINTLPLTNETRGLLSSERLMEMGGKILINVGRGPVIDEEGLYRALSGNVLVGAALDTWYTYPEGRTIGAPSRFPIHNLKNVLLSPHVGGFTKDALRANIDDSFDNLNAFLADGSLRSEVSLEEEY